jgi:hypothetical protein
MSLELGSWIVMFDGFKPTLEPRGRKVPLGTQPKETGMEVELPVKSRLVILKSSRKEYVLFSACHPTENEMRHFSATEEHFKKHCQQEGLAERDRAKKALEENQN